MRNAKLIAATCALTALGACDGNGGGRFTTPDANGDFPGSLNNEYQDSIIQQDGEGIAYRLGSTASRGFQSEAGLIPGTTVAPLPQGGVVRYFGSYEAGGWTNISIDGDMISANRQFGSGGVTIEADLSNGSFVGGSGSTLIINGTLNGTAVEGTVTYRGMTGDLQGLAGGDETFGVFAGENSNTNFAGGFIATTDPTAF